ncbi:hypothetical protein [Aquimarina sp. 2201CG5-10]|uniref:hypothetical protein n=1 Tax=Aquimarina callyspongiae TaxID=3098150 RepID=UPI002AB5590A|nr:hypothetical protein [Aquimarina sp. 2201CG5-10]MDY8138303.1 hypothetical protein [Aquimarina sp. 2201CG5-10]
MDSLEEFIKNNKHQFDQHKADKDKIWKNIEDKLEDRNSKTLNIWQSPFLKIAATIAIIFSIFSGAGLLINSGIHTNSNNSTTNQELNDINTYYKGLISLQVQMIQDNTKLQPEDKKEFLSFMDELDQEYILLKQEMTKNLNNEYILEAIVDNYKKRIELIENLLEQINDSKKSNTNEGYIL